jgi:predicted nucleic-acid-binding protein
LIALDTNVVARFYVDDPSDPEAAWQRPIARRIFESSAAIFVPLTVVLELEWVLRAFYGFAARDFARVIEHLAGLPHVTMEARAVVLAALDDHVHSLDFADALHLRASSSCEELLTFDDRRFARRARRLRLPPTVRVAD